MNFKKLIFGLLSVVLLASCAEKESDEVCENASQTCPGTDTSIDLTSCCTDQSCYWIYNGEQRAESELTAIITSACVTSTAQVDNADLAVLEANFRAMTTKLLQEARAASGCEY